MNFLVLVIAVAVLVFMLRKRQTEPLHLDFWSFATAFPNPVFTRELLTGLRSARLRWILLLYLLVPFAVIVASWPTDAVFYGGSDLALGVWHSYLLAQFWLVVLLTPIFAAYSVSSEFQQDTAELLWITRVPPPAIVIGKAAAVVLLCVALLVASLASLSLVFYLGGVGVSQIVNGFVFLLSAVIFTASVAIFHSSRTRQGHKALILTYLTLALLPCVAGPVVGGMLGRSALSLLACIPTLVLSAVFLAAAAGYARRPVGEATTVNCKPIDDPLELRERRRNWPYYLVDPLRRIPPMPEGGNVVAHHEWRVHPLHRTDWGYRCIAVMGGLTGVLLFWGAADALGERFFSVQRGWIIGLSWLNFTLTAIWTVLLHGVSMTIDQESGTLEGLRLTTIRPREFLLGKWLGSLRMRWIMIVIGVSGVLLSSLLGREGAAFTLVAPLAWWGMVELVGLLVFAVASFCSRTMVAVALGFAAATALVAGSVWLANAALDPGWEIRLGEWMPFAGGQALIIVKGIIFVLLGVAFWHAALVGVYRKWNVER